ncbi:glycosyltransferase [Phormidium sp. FACHB-592]|uniref:Glycosyltransferase n=1 Tax=Stenomitos frigidus AS-A4 TaxID=2933935 RepID=A0ABV0KKM4_9CYAN|nr:glycosyltransferase [Phormidium sp. FACHB-592]MBD2075260.1 glycosyltransferase [Phormidium sp. FACHB-592]
MKVLFINNYPMDHAWELWQKGEYPGHHLWGATHLAQHDIEVKIFPYQTSKLLNKIGRKLGLGDHLDQQVRILFSRTDYDVIYSACQTNTFLLALLRSLRLFRKPLVALIHHPLKHTLRNALFLNGHDHLLCLSSTTMQPYRLQPNPSKKMDLLEWGADLSFYETKVPTVEVSVSNAPLFVSAGKTKRDHNTLVKAVSSIDCLLKIYCSAATAPTVAYATERIEVTASNSHNNAVSYPAILAAYRRAFAIAIPLTETEDLAGLTSLLDAMVVGKPVIMTRNKHIDLDLEKEGIGLWVEPNDIAGWQRAIAYLLAHPEEAAAMGDRGRRLCETKYNLDVFTNTLARALKSVLV